MEGLEFLYVTLLLTGFLGSAGLVWWANRRTARLDTDIPEIPEPVADPKLSRPAFGTATRQLTPTEQLPAMLAEASSPPIAQLLFATRNASGDRECPTCKRRFAETTVLCPFDATPLQSMALKSRRTTRPATTGASRPTCRACGRRYESAARFCYHDGNRLSADSPAEVPIIRACRACGHESADERSHCSCEHPEIVEVDPSRASIVMPTIPMMHCRRCDHVAAPGQTHCPHDDELLFPVMNVSMNALPPAGIGPRRKVCDSCGRKFASSAAYCSYDGTRLKHLN